MEPSPHRRRALVLVVAVASILVGGLLLTSQRGRIQRLEGQMRAKQQQLALVEAQAQDLAQQVAGIQTERDALAARLASVQEQVDKATTETQRAQLAVTKAESHAAELEAERSQLQAQLVLVSNERDAAQEEIQRLEQGRKDLAEAIKRLRGRLALITRDYREAQAKLAEVQAVGTPAPAPSPSSIPGAISISGPPTQPAAAAPQPPLPTSIPGTVELPPIVVRPTQAGITTRLHGRIVDVNDGHQFIVVDQGQDDGVYLGMSFDIVRGTSTVGRATVVRVRPQLAACDIVQDHSPGPILVGDLAVQRGP